MSVQEYWKQVMAKIQQEQLAREKARADRYARLRFGVHYLGDGTRLECKSDIEFFAERAFLEKQGIAFRSCYTVRDCAGQSHSTPLPKSVAAAA